MNKIDKHKCDFRNDILEMTCKIEETYRDNFEAQAELFKQFFSEIKSQENRDDTIKDFISKQTVENRKKVINDILKPDNDDKILYLGIPGSLGRSYSKVEESVKNLNNVLSKYINDNSDNIIKVIKDEKIAFGAITTSIMYLFFPDHFIPIAGPMNDLLCKLGIKRVDSWETYKNALEELKKLNNCCCKNGHLKSSFTIALSFTSWLMENQVENILNKFIDQDRNKPKNIILTEPSEKSSHSP